MRKRSWLVPLSIVVGAVANPALASISPIIEPNVASVRGAESSPLASNLGDPFAFVLRTIDQPALLAGHYSHSSHSSHSSHRSHSSHFSSR
jgi:hypothetical protein